MKKYLYYIACIGCLLGYIGLLPSTDALDLRTEVPVNDAYVTDLTQSLEPEEEQQLEQQLQNLWQEQDIEGGVLVIASLSGASLEDLSYRTATEWGIGDAESNNGFLLLISLEDRRFRLEIGYGLEPVITDGIAQRILRTQAAPALQDGRLYEAIRDVIISIQAYSMGEEFVDSSSDTDTTQALLSWAIILFGVGWGTLPFLLWNISDHPHNPSKRKMKKYAFAALPMIFFIISALASSYVGWGIISILYGAGLTALLGISTKYYTNNSNGMSTRSYGYRRGGGSSFGSSFGGFSGGSFGGGGASGGR